jgi:hypothetical protein
MISLHQQRLAAVVDTTANLITQLRELEGLREQVRKAELARRSLRHFAIVKSSIGLGSAHDHIC